MSDELKQGDHVSWDAGNQSSEGTVERKITSDTKAGGRRVRASDAEPQYEVRSTKSGRTAVHRPDAIHKT